MKRSSLDQACTFSDTAFSNVFFGHVCVLRVNFINMTIVKCIEHFNRYYNLRNNVGSLVCHYEFLNNKYIRFMKNPRLFGTKIEKFYWLSTVDSCMFGWVEGIKSVFPNLTLEQAIEGFKEHWNLSEDDYSLDSAKATYAKIKRIVNT